MLSGDNYLKKELQLEVGRDEVKNVRSLELVKAT